MLRRPPRSTRTDTLFPYTTLFRSPSAHTASLAPAPVWPARPLAAAVVRSDFSSLAAGSTSMTTPIHITHVIVGLDVGGAERFLLRLIESHHNDPRYRHRVIPLTRSEARRVGKECVSKCRYRGSPYH